MLDPITIALHLHAYYVAMADDFIRYTSTYADQPPAEQDAIRKRLKKVLLARVLQSVISADYHDEKTGAGSNTLVNALNNQSAVDDFLADYDKQVSHRVRWRDRWASYLCNWLRGAPMKLAEAAHLVDPKNDFGKFLVPWCLSITRTCKSPEGRKLLQEILDDDKHFAHRVIFPQKQKASAEFFEMGRKYGSAILEGLKEWGPIIAVKGNKEVIKFFKGALVNEFGWENEIYWERSYRNTFQKIEHEINFEPKWEGAIGKIQSLPPGRELRAENGATSPPTTKAAIGRRR